MLIAISKGVCFTFFGAAAAGWKLTEASSQQPPTVLDQKLNELDQKLEDLTKTDPLPEPETDPDPLPEPVAEPPVLAPEPKPAMMPPVAPPPPPAPTTNGTN